MKLKAFAVRNVPYERIEGVFVAPTAGLAIRDNSPFLARVSPSFEQDLKLYEIGEFNDDGTLFSAYDDMVYHSWDEWKKPESPVVKMSDSDKASFASQEPFAENR